MKKTRVKALYADEQGLLMLMSGLTEEELEGNEDASLMYLQQQEQEQEHFDVSDTGSNPHSENGESPTDSFPNSATTASSVPGLQLYFNQQQGTQIQPTPSEKTLSRPATPTN
jgi:hypothetical protein